MFETGDWSEGDVAAVIINPIYAFRITPEICSAPPPQRSEGEWVEANAQLVARLSPGVWLRFLSTVLQDPEICNASPSGRPVDVGDPVNLGECINPATAITVHSRFSDPHPLAITEDEWVRVNALLIKNEMGARTYLQNLLAVLRGATLLTDGNFYGYATPRQT